MTGAPDLPDTRRYEILREIGAGGAGRVYLARDRYTGSGPLALKIFDAGSDAGRALENEFLALKSLSHPGLVRVFDRGRLPETGEPFITSEYLEGTDFLSAARGAPHGRILDLTVQALEVLEYIHRRGYVHRDVKPGNLLVLQDGRVKLLDFGLAVREGGPGSEGKAGGTFPYVPPEALAGRPVDRRADLYSLGILLYQVLTGKDPARGEDLLPEIRSEELEGLPPPFDKLLPGLVMREPGRRPAGAADVLRRISEETGVRYPAEAGEREGADLAGPFVGREVELGQLMAGLRSVVLRRGEGSGRRLILVTGEAGIGKRHLLGEFRDRCQREGVDCFTARCFGGEVSGTRPFEPVFRALLARVGPGSPIARHARKALARILPELATSGLESGVPAISGSEERLAWMEEVVNFFRAASQGGAGFVLAVEDLHRASHEVIELVGYLSRTLCLADGICPPLLMVFSLRDGEDIPSSLRALLAELSDEGLLAHVHLPRFTGSEVAAWVSGVLGMPEAPRRLVRVLHEKTGGNPLYLEQLLKALVEQGTIYYHGSRWRVRDLTRVRIPDTVVKLIERRLLGLSRAQQEALEVVACYGEPVPRWILDEILGPRASQVSELLKRQILEERDRGEAVAFRHKMAEQHVLERGSPRRLRRLHTRIGEVLELLAGKAGIRPGKIAHHMSLGEDRVKALRYALEAAARLRRERSYEQAARYYSRALSRLEREDPRRPDLLEALGDCHVGSGRLEPAAAAYGRAIEEAGEGDASPELHRKLAEVDEQTGAYAAALRSVKAGLDRVDPDEPADRIPFLRLLGGIHKQLGEYTKAIECIREGLRLARGGPSEETVSLLNLLGNVYMLRGEHRKALSLQLRSLRFSQSLSFDTGAAASLHNLGTLMGSWGDAERAVRYYTESLRISERLGNLPAVALTYNNLGNIHTETGDGSRAEYYHRRSLAIRRRIGDPFGIAMSFGNIGSMHRLMGHWGLAVAYYERAVRHFERIGNEYGAALFRTHLASLLMEIGDLDRAARLLAPVERASQRLGFRRVAGIVQLLRGRLDRLQGRPLEAQRRLTRAIEFDRETSYREGAAEGILESGMVHRDRRRPGQALRAASLALEEARAVRSEALAARCLLLRGALGSPGDRSRGDIEEALAIAGRLGRRDLLAEALAVRARRALDGGDLERAAADVKEAQELTAGLGASLPEDLATIFRNDPRRETLRETARAVKDGLEASGWANAAAMLGTGDRMKPENLARLLTINKQLNSETELPRLLDLIIDTAVELTGAERGFLILVEGKRISFQVARNFRRAEVKEPELKISRSIVGQVMKTGETVLTDNAREDERFARFASVDDLKLTSILSVPFESRGRRLGALYLDNQARKGVFTEEDVETVKALADQAAIAIQNLKSRVELTQRVVAQNVELQRVRKALDERPYKYDYSEIIGGSARMKEVFLLLDKIIDTEVPVLIQGESGTGKELVARAIHYRGPRKDGPFVTVNSGAIPENLLESEFFGYVRGAFTGATGDKDGLFVQAHRGTLFLDEIGDMDYDMQRKLLRVLQQGEVRPVGGKKTVTVDVRIVCATNKDLRQRMLERKFREDLYYRINVITVDLPPLRERREDIPALIDHFLRKTVAEMNLPVKEVDSEAIALLTAYSWPGNVRELENEVKKALALSDEVIGADDLSPHIQGERGEKEPSLVPAKGTLKETMEATEKSIITRALEETGGNQTRAAKNLGISRVWLRKKMEKYGLLS